MAKQDAPYVPVDPVAARQQIASELVDELRRLRKTRGVISRDFSAAMKRLNLLRKHHGGRMPDALETLRLAFKAEVEALGELGGYSSTLMDSLDTLCSTLQSSFGVSDNSNVFGGVEHGSNSGTADDGDERFDE
jgi:hypothetical protein